MSCQALCIRRRSTRDRHTCVMLLQYARDGDMCCHGCRAVRLRRLDRPRERTAIRRSPRAQERARQRSQRCRRHKRVGTAFQASFACTGDVYTSRDGLGRMPGTRTRSANTPPSQSKCTVQLRASRGRHHCFSLEFDHCGARARTLRTFHNPHI